MADPVTVALHIELEGDPEKVKAAAKKLAKDLGARTATVSTHEGTWNVLRDEGIEATTIEGKKVTIRNPAHYDAFPKTIERVAPDPTAEDHLIARGDHQELAALAKRMTDPNHVADVRKRALAAAFRKTKEAAE